jgi:hypothetical protein
VNRKEIVERRNKKAADTKRVNTDAKAIFFSYGKGICSMKFGKFIDWIAKQHPNRLD